MVHLRWMNLFIRLRSVRIFPSLWRLSVYEHRTFVQGVIWNINSFDQWGVELGKTLAENLNRELEQGKSIKGYDSSTNGLLSYCLDQ